MNSNSGERFDREHMFVIGITGGIGSGKTVVTNHLRGRSYAVCDADEVAREATRPGEPAPEALSNEFGRRILMRDGSLDRRKLANIAFADEKKTARLNEIMHADISRRIDESLKSFEKMRVPDDPCGAKQPKIVFLSAPLLFEAGLETRCDEIWLIVADEDVRIRRAASRDGLTEAEIRVRATRQMSDSEKRKRADVVIENDGDEKALLAKIDRLLE